MQQLEKDLLVGKKYCMSISGGLIYFIKILWLIPQSIFSLVLKWYRAAGGQGGLRGDAAIISLDGHILQIFWHWGNTHLIFNMQQTIKSLSKNVWRKVHMVPGFLLWTEILIRL